MGEQDRPRHVTNRWIMLRYPEVDSTNDLCKTLVLEEPGNLPLVVLADRQTAGRGQGSRTWWSDEGSLTVSVVVDPAAYGVSVGQSPRIALTAGVLLIDVLEFMGVPRGAIGIRWPNDLEAAGRKLAGILPEWVDTSGGGRLILGVGLNLTTNLRSAPDEVRRMATSIDELSNSQAPEKLAFLHQFLERLPLHLIALGENDSSLAERWSELDTLLGARIRIDLGDGLITGRATGITPDGGLRLAVDGSASSQASTMRVLHGGRVLREAP